MSQPDVPFAPSNVAIVLAAFVLTWFIREIPLREQVGSTGDSTP